MNAFMSLVATFLLDLSRWSPFIKTPVHEIVGSLYSVRWLAESAAECDRLKLSSR
jgi:hypothetical protein